MAKRRLTDKQQAFVDEYLIDLNATQAAIRAGYSAKSAGDIGRQELHKTPVAEAIARAKAERSRRTGINADRVVQELARIAFVQPSDVLDLNTASVKDNVAADDMAVISGVKVKYIPRKEVDDDGEITVIETVEREVKLCDKIKALDMLAKHLGMYEKDASKDDEEDTGVIMMPPVEQIAPPEDGDDNA